MKENYRRKTKISMDSSEEIDFQSYIDSVKQKSTTWHIFENLMKDLAYSSIPRLTLLNAILLIELTKNDSYLDRLKYHNSLLMTEFKEFIERKDDNFLKIENEFFDESVEFDSNNAEMIGEKNETQTAQHFVESQNSNGNNDLYGSDQFGEFQEVFVATDLKNEITQEENETQIAQLSLEDEGKEHLEQTITKSNQMEQKTKMFTCQLCNKVLYNQFHLKQHIRNIHENTELENENSTSENGDRKIEEITSESKVKMPISSKNEIKKQDDPYYKRQYRTEWESDFPWVQKDPGNNTSQRAYCAVCCEILLPKYNSLLKHQETSKHKVNLKSGSSYEKLQSSPTVANAYFKYVF